MIINEQGQPLFRFEHDEDEEDGGVSGSGIAWWETCDKWQSEGPGVACTTEGISLIEGQKHEWEDLGHQPWIFV